MANELALGCDCLGQIHYLVRYFSHVFNVGDSLLLDDSQGRMSVTVGSQL